jgi:heme-degrading monooxygenase HmoA
VEDPLDGMLTHVHGCLSAHPAPYQEVGNMAAAQAYSSGDWHVRAGSEEAYVARWTEFLDWTRDSAPGFASARLVRDVAESGHFVSLGEWDSAQAAAAWMTLPGFAAKYGACTKLCEQAQGSRYELAAEVHP